MSFFAYAPFFNGGVVVAGGDNDGDGRVDLIIGAGLGRRPARSRVQRSRRERAGRVHGLPQAGERFRRRHRRTPACASPVPPRRRSRPARRHVHGHHRRAPRRRRSRQRHAAGRRDASSTTAMAPATLAGTPAVGTGGTYPLTFTADNGVGSAGDAGLHADGDTKRRRSPVPQRRPSRSARPARSPSPPPASRCRR